MAGYVTGKRDDSANSYSRQATMEANERKLQSAITKDPDMNEQQRQNMRDYRDVQNSEDNPNHNPGGYAKGGAVSGCNGRVTLAQLRKRHGGSA